VLAFSNPPSGHRYNHRNWGRFPGISSPQRRDKLSSATGLVPSMRSSRPLDVAPLASAWSSALRFFRAAHFAHTNAIAAHDGRPNDPPNVRSTRSGLDRSTDRPIGIASLHQPVR
jgi:hypothetical protein